MEMCLVAHTTFCVLSWAMEVCADLFVFCLLSHLGSSHCCVLERALCSESVVLPESGSWQTDSFVNGKCKSFKNSKGN